ncbi:uncharacterized protein LOC128334386 isoform X2 [Hemicordylus capensis]|uniref:uncharacterized protein LOC128334386 isoform X2 n=1 Tax=Hemicordylus capensis TaxID=884348 RepID=UPI002302EBDD|nr:uncharacterized protein LOC128334386 isoform X2 [Hemicordylus capensis]
MSCHLPTAPSLVFSLVRPALPTEKARDGGSAASMTSSSSVVCRAGPAGWLKKAHEGNGEQGQKKEVQEEEEKQAGRRRRRRDEKKQEETGSPGAWQKKRAGCASTRRTAPFLSLSATDHSAWGCSWTCSVAFLVLDFTSLHAGALTGVGARPSPAALNLSAPSPLQLGGRWLAPAGPEVCALSRPSMGLGVLLFRATALCMCAELPLGRLAWGCCFLAPSLRGMCAEPPLVGAGGVSFLTPSLMPCALSLPLAGLSLGVLLPLAPSLRVCALSHPGLGLGALLCAARPYVSALSRPSEGWGRCFLSPRASRLCSEKPLIWPGVALSKPCCLTLLRVVLSWPLRPAHGGSSRSVASRTSCSSSSSSLCWLKAHA